jgi:hypothetical protein
LVIALFACRTAFAQTCTYETWDWDTVQKRVTHRHQIVKPATELTVEEKGVVPGCSVCEEDQVEVHLAGLAAFKVCRVLEPRISRAVRASLADGFPISTVVGYRVGRTRGPVDATGARTEFSNHSYGVAVDFNAAKNGLYDRCIQFGPKCHLLRGGAYDPGQPGTITSATSLYRFMRAEGFKWGGEISARQKDFMHFSLTGM